MAGRTLWVTGAGGVVGTKLVEQARASGTYERILAFAHAPARSVTAAEGASQEESEEVDTPTSQLRIVRATLDIGDREAVQHAAATYPPTVILNPAAMTNVDACERAPEAAWQANAAGPRHLAEVAQAQGAHLIHVSTDYVFPGDEAHPGPYREDDPTHAISSYGRSKLGGEEAVRAVCGDATPATIVRTALVYGLIPGGRANFVTWLGGELRAGRRVRIVRDQYNTPTLADDLAAVLLWLAERQVTGIYHAAGPDLLGRHEWALAIAQAFDLDTSLIDWVTSAELAQPAPRPLRSGLHCERLHADQERGAPAMRGVAAGLTAFDWLSAPARTTS